MSPGPGPHFLCFIVDLQVGTLNDDKIMNCFLKLDFIDHSTAHSGHLPRDFPANDGITLLDIRAYKP